MYLNENCKNALNLEDFVKQITVSLQDLDYSKENGYAKGVTNILVKQLNDLSPTERPIHCSDKKRMKFYVKDDNKWAKDDNNVKFALFSFFGSISHLFWQHFALFHFIFWQQMQIKKVVFLAWREV